MAVELLSKYKVEQKHRVIGAFALVYWLLSFWWERFAFYEGAAEARPVTHIVIKLLTLITIYLTALFFTNAVQGFKARGVIKHDAVLLGVASIKGADRVLDRISHGENLLMS